MTRYLGKVSLSLKDKQQKEKVMDKIAKHNPQDEVAQKSSVSNHTCSHESDQLKRLTISLALRILFRHSPKSRSHFQIP